MSTAHPRRIAVPSEGRSGRPQANLASGLLSRRSARARRARAVVRGDGSALGSWAGRAPRWAPAGALPPPWRVWGAAGRDS